MANILNGFTPSVYTPVTVNAPIEQMAGIFKNWNDRYLQGQDQADKIGQLLSTVDVHRADQNVLDRVGTDVRNQIAGTDYAMMQPAIHSAYKSLTQDPELNAAIAQKASMAAQAADIQKQYEKGDLSANARDYHLGILASGYKGIGHYDANGTAPIDPSLPTKPASGFSGTGAYVQGADAHGKYDTYQGPATVKSINLPTTIEDIIKGYREAADTISSTSKSTTQQYIGGQGTKDTSPGIATTGSTSGKTVTKMMPLSMLQARLMSDSNNVASIDQDIAAMYYKVGRQAPTGDALLDARKNYVNQIIASSPTFKDKVSMEHGSISDLGLNSGFGTDEKTKPTVYQTVTTGAQPLPINTNSNIVKTLGIPTTESLSATGQQGNDLWAAKVTSMLPGEHRTPEQILTKLADNRTHDMSYKPNTLPISIPQMGARLSQYITNLKNDTSDIGQTKYNEYLSTLHNAVEKEHPNWTPTVQSTYVDKLLKVQNTNDITSLLNLHNAITKDASTNVPIPVQINGSYDAPQSGKGFTEQTNYNKNILSKIPLNTVKVVPLGATSPSDITTADKLVPTGGSIEMVGHSKNDGTSRIVNDKTFSTGIKAAILDKTGRVQQIVSMASDPTMFSNMPTLMNEGRLNDIRSSITDPNFTKGSIDYPNITIPAGNNTKLHIGSAQLVKKVNPNGSTTLQMVNQSNIPITRPFTTGTKEVPDIETAIQAVNNDYSNVLNLR